MVLPAPVRGAPALGERQRGVKPTASGLRQAAHPRSAISGVFRSQKKFG